MESLDTQLLNQLAERKLHLLTQLRDLTLDQRILVSEQRVEELLVLLSRKSEAIEDLQHIQADLRQFQNQEPDQRAWASQTEREACRSRFEKCESLITELLVMENDSLEELSQRRDLVGQQLQQFVTADTIHVAYHGGSTEADDSSTFSLDG